MTRVISKIIHYAETAMYNSRFIKIFGRLFVVYPIDEDNGTLEKCLSDFFWFFLHAMYWLLAITEVAAVCKAENVSAWLYPCLEIAITYEILFRMIFFKLKRGRLQVLLRVHKEFSKFIMENDLRLGIRYRRMFTLIYILLLLISVLAMFLYISKIVVYNPPSLSGYYPPIFYSPKMKVSMFVFDLLIIVYSSSFLVTDFMATALISVATLKLQLLKEEFEKEKDYETLTRCVRKHVHIIWYIRKINDVTNPIILHFYISSTIFFISAGLSVNSSEFTDTMQFQVLVFSTICFLRLYIYSFCGEHLRQSGHDLWLSVYLSTWYCEDRKMKKAKLFIICQCQKDLSISISGFIPSLGMEYSGRFLALIFSYTLTLRAVAKV